MARTSPDKTNQRIAIVTGASSGIGQATALALSRSGYTVYAAQRTLDDKADDNENIVQIVLDVTDSSSIKSCVDIILKKEGRIDVLINNAGYGSYGSLEEVPLDEARQQFDVNIFGLAELTQAVLPHMRERHSGTIVMISSIAGKISFPFGSWYHASKHALEALSDSLRLEVKPFGISVIIIEPGGIKTRWSDKAMDSLVAISGKGPYATASHKARKSLSVDDKSPGPEVIADVIAKALSKKNPRARYHAGYSSSIVIYRRFIPDRLLDWIIERKIL